MKKEKLIFDISVKQKVILFLIDISNDLLKENKDLKLIIRKNENENTKV